MSEGVACCHWNMSQVLQVLDEYFEGGLQRDRMKTMMVCRVVVSVVVPRKRWGVLCPRWSVEVR